MNYSRRQLEAMGENPAGVSMVVGVVASQPLLRLTNPTYPSTYAPKLKQCLAGQ